jgi:serine/threonine protein phosphatase 1
LLESLFRRAARAGANEPTVSGRAARVPPGVCVYAIGDIHGRADLLTAMYELIADDAAHLAPGIDRILVYVGDYVDRGLESRQVIDVLIGDPLPAFKTVHLLGNHDAWLLSFLVDAQIGSAWLRYGGDVTLNSYGVRPVGPAGGADYYDKLQVSLRARLPRDHVEFLRQLELSFEIGDEGAQVRVGHPGARPPGPAI